MSLACDGWLNAMIQRCMFMSCETWIYILGFAGQALFMSRFLIQWIYSEKHKKSVIPRAFWYFSLGGGILLLAYAILQKDPVFISGQSFGLLVYLRNIYFIRKADRKL
ncbi:MAG: hypothetical protein C0582_01760 [Alphaproteobacteria bacterium]|nr:MAG: hypothetical protein C0582_01760 [Alphaproteobacteria bacterium]